MPRIPIYNAASDIIQAFEMGRQSRRQREQDQLKKDQDARDFTEKQREFNERLKQEQEQLKLTTEWHKAQIDVQNLMKKIQLGQLKNSAAADLREEGFPQVPSNYAEENAPMINAPTYQPYADVGLPEIVFRGPDFPSKGNKVLKMEMDAANKQADRESRETLNRENQGLRAQQLDIMKAVADSNASFKEGMLGISRQNAETNRLRAEEANKRSSGGRKQVVNIIQQLKSDPLYKRYQNASESFNWVSDPEYYKKNDLPGLRQIDLIYRYMKTQDDSVVKPTEFDVAAKGAMSYLQRLGYKVRGITDPKSPMLSPAAEESMRQRLKIRNKIVGGEFDKLVRSKHELSTFATDETPDYDTFKNMIYNSGMTDQPQLPPHPTGGKVLRRVQ